MAIARWVGSLTIEDQGVVREHRVFDEGFPVASGLPKSEKVTVAASSFQALSPPTGAVAVLIDPGDYVNLTLKGVTGDAGIGLTKTSAPIEIPCILSLKASPSIGIANGEAADAVVDVLWM